MANIRQLKEGDDVTVFYPQTHVKAVIDSEGNTLDEILENLEPAGVEEAVKFTPQTLTTAQKTQARTNIGAGTYSKAGTGIPASDMASAVQTSLGKADTAYQKPSGGIPKTDLASAVQGSLDLADTAIQSQPIGSITPPVDPSEYATAEELSQLDQKVKEGISVQTFEYSSFTAQTSASNIVVENDTFYMTQAGDYIELKAKAKGDNGNILRRPTSSNPPCMRWYGEHTLQIRFNSSTQWTYQNNAVDWNKTQVLKVVLDSVVDTTFNYKIYLDGTQVGTQAVTNGTSWTQIGYGYDGDLYYIKAKVGGGDEVVFTEFSKMTGAVGVTDVYSSEEYDGLIGLNARVDALEPKIAALEHAVTGEDMYFRFHKTSTHTNLQSHFGIYQRIKGNYYLLTDIGYYVYAGSAGYPNGYWRVERTDIGTLIDGEWARVQSQVLTAGENEFVLQWLAGSGYNFSGGFSGGYHYGETIDNVVGAWVEFVADGNRLSTDADIPLTPCKSFYYREYSPIYQHNDDTIAAWHLKETEFKDGGYETINDVNFVQALDYFAYPGIACVSRWLSEKAMPEGVATITDMGDGSTTIAEQFKSNGHRIHYEGNGYMCDVESEVLIGADDAQCQRVVYNSSAYNKFYRRNPDTVGSTSNRLKGRTKVKIAAM